MDGKFKSAYVPITTSLVGSSIFQLYICNSPISSESKYKLKVVPFLTIVVNIHLPTKFLLVFI